MTLILGGSYQGKLQYALDSVSAAASIDTADIRDYTLAQCDVMECGDMTTIPTPFSLDKRIINNIDKLILLIVSSGGDAPTFINELISSGALSDKTVICNDISCGVVPVDPLMRAWREAVGRSLVLLSAEADAVIRMFCGIGTKIK